jgi:hypothetical protein
MIKKSNTRWYPRGVVRTVCQFGPWIVISLFLVAALGQADSAALAGLFQSPPTVTPTSEALPTPAIEITPTLVEAPVITATMPVDAGSEEGDSTPVRGRYPDEGSDLEFEWGMLFDSMALGLSYVWLCCGVGFMLLLPLFFLALWVAVRRRRRRME